MPKLTRTDHAERNAALQSGASTFHGQACSTHGVAPLRYTLNGRCVACCKASALAQRIAEAHSSPDVAAKRGARAKARQDGRRFYFGAACPHGHDGKRYTSTGGCVGCTKAAHKRSDAEERAYALAKAQGMFTYPLHPDDFAKAHAYCQSLDLSRMRLPQPTPHRPGPMTAVEVEIARAMALGRAAATAPPPAEIKGLHA